MAIFKETQYIFWCETCTECRTVNFIRTKRKAIKEVKTNGWNVDSEDKCTCTVCQREKVLGQ